MNFAAQLFYSSYLSERLERLFSPRPALKDSEENDPFWQRWEITARILQTSPLTSLFLEVRDGSLPPQCFISSIPHPYLQPVPPPPPYFNHIKATPHHTSPFHFSVTLKSKSYEPPLDGLPQS